jgi:NAD(P)-dependent dehydrogenase (short-subunit alcohol dehydrogenase family)
MAGRLDGRIAIVTGAARGIGRAIATRLHADGAHVTFADLDPDEAEAAVRAADPDSARAAAHPVDVRDRVSVEALVEAVVARQGGPDIMVPNAGIMDRMPFLEMTDEFWHRVLGINLHGAFLCGQAAARRMVAQGRGGRIVNISSNSGIFGGRGRAAYGASKAGIINLTQTMAIELAEHGITVNAVAPGPTRTGPHMPEGPWPSVRARMPLARFGRPEEIAAVAAFLASDEASFVTGHTYAADGGYTVAGIMEG